MSNFEWYYFDFHTDDGYDIVFTLHTRPFMSVFNVSIFDLFVYQGERRLLHHFFIRPQDQMSIGCNPFILRFDDHNYFIREQGCLELSVRDAQVALQVKIENLFPDRKPLEENLYPDTAQGKTFKWILYLPLGHAAGSFKSSSLQIPIEGQAYHDYNAGDINLKKELSGWYWGKFYRQDSLLILGEIITANRQKKSIFVNATPDIFEVDKEPRVIISGSDISLQSSSGSFSFSCEQDFLIDDIYFLVDTWSSSLLPFVKLREIAAALTLEKQLLRPLNRILTNGCYQRFRKTGRDEQGISITSFQERIFF